MSLITKRDLKTLLELQGPEALAELKHRRTGRSTRIALETLLRALDCPGTAIPVQDHYDTKESNRRLLRVIGGMVEDLRLEHMKFNTVNNTITFTWENPFEDRE